LIKGKALDELLERLLRLVRKERETEGDIPPLLLVCRGRVAEALAKLLNQILRLLILFESSVDLIIFERDCWGTHLLDERKDVLHHALEHLLLHCVRANREMADDYGLQLSR
jgi:hypothetical protein